MIICPGGGYWELMDDFEGRDYALWLNERGITAFVLKYRLASAGYHHPEITGDVQRAIRFVRAHAAAWGLDGARIGVMGSSAGGHLASYAMTHHETGDAGEEDPIDAFSSRPDLGVLCYPVISSSLSRMNNLAGDNSTPALQTWLSSEMHVSEATPPCFLWHTAADEIVSAKHSLLFAEALRARGVPCELHIYPEGCHSIALGVHGYKPGTGQTLHPWTLELERWLSARKWIHAHSYNV
ncbi:MAG: endo,4-beta-xylanase [Rariglobus sp.]|nr:endo,4-beta-xylanase [Rariglobus sp.]